MGVIVNIMQIASVRRIIDDAEKQIEAETGAPVKLSILMNKDEFVDADFIIRLTCSITGVTKEMIRSASRNRVSVDARKIITILMRDYLEANWVEIGDMLGSRDHTTAIHLYNTACNHIHTQDTIFFTKYEMVKRAFLNHLQRLKDESKAE